MKVYLYYFPEDTKELVEKYKTKKVEAKYIINNLISINIEVSINIGVNTKNNKVNKPIVIYKE